MAANLGRIVARRLSTSPVVSSASAAHGHEGNIVICIRYFAGSK